MPERTSYPPGTFSWVDLSTPDVDAAKAFYGAVLGWDYHDLPTSQGGSYTAALVDGKSVAGMMEQMEQQRQAGVPPNWLSYVTVEDVEATAAKAESLGGKIHAPVMDVDESGRMAVLAGPGGEVFAIWQPGRHIGAQIVHDPGSLTWNELATRDLEQATRFYAGVFGWNIQTAPVPGTDMIYTMGAVGERANAGFIEMNEEWPDDVPPHWMVYLAVADIDAAVAAVTANGGAVAVEPFEVESVGRMAVIADSTGAMVSLMQHPEGMEFD